MAMKRAFVQACAFALFLGIAACSQEPGQPADATGGDSFDVIGLTADGSLTRSEADSLVLADGTNDILAGVAVDEIVTESAVGVIDSLGTEGEADFVEQVAQRHPLRVLCTILGVPREDWSRMFDWTNAIVGAQDPEYGNALSGVVNIERESEIARLNQEREIEIRKAEQRSEIVRERSQRDTEAEHAEIPARALRQRSEDLVDQAVEVASDRRFSDT